MKTPNAAEDPFETENTPATEDDPKRKKSKRGRDKPGFYDDGRVLADMNVDGFSWYAPSARGKKAVKNDPDKATKKETRAMIVAQLKIILPRMLIVIGSFVLVMLLCTLWLNHWKF